ncbi:hypothetical protein AAHC03_016396 [Spirometra sp. Aus1]
MLLDRHHDHHRRQEEDGEDGTPVTPAKYSSVRRKRPRGKLEHLGGLYDGDTFIDGDNEDDYEIEDEVDDDLAPVDDGDGVTRRTITLIKSARKPPEPVVTKVESLAQAPLPPKVEPPTSSAANSNADVSSSGGGSAATLAAATPASSRRLARARRLPAWYKDYDTDYMASEENSAIERERVQAQLPPGIELDDPNATNPNVPTEEWNIVVYDDEEDVGGAEAEDHAEDGEVETA